MARSAARTPSGHPAVADLLTETPRPVRKVWAAFAGALIASALLVPELTEITLYVLPPPAAVAGAAERIVFGLWTGLATFAAAYLTPPSPKEGVLTEGHGNG